MMTDIPSAADGRTAVARRPTAEAAGSRRTAGGVADPPSGAAAPPATARRAPMPDIDPEREPVGGRILIGVFTGIPFLALLAAIPLMWGWGLGWHDVVIALAFYWLSGLGVTIGFHRGFTHRSFKAIRPVRIALAIAGSLALEGEVLVWCADHRRHHKYSDREGDPHSPWRFGDDWKALTKGMLWAHMGWLFDPERTSQERFVPDLLADSDIRRISRAFPALMAVSLFLPAAIGGLWSMSWHGAITAFFWASLVRVSLLHHVTWSINSICHTFGEESFEVRDKSRNVWWLAIASFGESWHNLHHADPTCARHGALRGQVDPSARVIWWFEKLGWVYDVRWPDPQKLGTRQAESAGRRLGSMARLARDARPARRTVAAAGATAGTGGTAADGVAADGDGAGVRRAAR